MPVDLAAQQVRSTTVNAAAVIVHIAATSVAASIHTFIFINSSQRDKKLQSLRARMRAVDMSFPLKRVSRYAYPSSGRRLGAHTNCCDAVEQTARLRAAEAQKGSRACSRLRCRCGSVSPTGAHPVRALATHSTGSAKDAAPEEKQAAGNTSPRRASDECDARVFGRTVLKCSGVQVLRLRNPMQPLLKPRRERARE